MGGAALRSQPPPLPVVDPALMLRSGVGGGGGFVLLALLAFLPSVIFSFFTVNSVSCFLLTLSVIIFANGVKQ